MGSERSERQQGAHMACSTWRAAHGVQHMAEPLRLINLLLFGGPEGAGLQARRLQDLPTREKIQHVYNIDDDMDGRGMMDGSGASDMSIDPKGFVKIMRFIFLLLNVGIVILNAYFLYYVYQIEATGCKCALGWRRSFLEVSLALFVVVGIVGLVVDWQDHFMWLAALYNGLIIAYIFVTREFINDMRAHTCKCAQTEAFDILNVVNIIGLFMLGITLFSLLGLVLFWVLTKGGEPPIGGVPPRTPSPGAARMPGRKAGRKVVRFDRAGRGRFA